MQENELLIKPHYLTALVIYFVKSLFFIFVFVLSFKIIDRIIGYSLIYSVLDTLKTAIINITQLGSSLSVSIINGFMEDELTSIILSAIILTFAQHNNIINRYWKFTFKEIEFTEGFFGMKIVNVPLDKISRVYAIPKADFRNIGNMRIELSIRDKAIRMPFVYYSDDVVKEISGRVDKYKEGLIEEDLKKEGKISNYPKSKKEETALDILRKKFAKGEISEREFLKRKKILAEI